MYLTLMLRVSHFDLDFLFPKNEMLVNVISLTKTHNLSHRGNNNF